LIIESTILKQLEPTIQKVVQKIKEAVTNKQPIILRHHNDADGYCAGIALEKAILPLLYKNHTRERDMFFYYTRSPCTAPFYSYGDATRDVTNFLNNQKRFDMKAPLIIIVDNGSSDQDRAAIKKVKIYGAEVLVVDHHPIDKETDDVIDIHLNPHKIGSTYDFSAGMLCAEIGNLLHPGEYLFIAAVSATADRVTSKEAKAYVELVQKECKIDEGHLRRVSECLDYEAFFLGNMESRKPVHDLLDPKSNEHEKLIILLKDEIKKALETINKTTEHYSTITDNGDKLIATLPIDKLKRRNNYPRSGKIIGRLQDHLGKNTELNPELKPVISLGLNADSINFRCSQSIKGFDVNEIIHKLKQQLPHAQIDGGGHRVAGSMRFVEAAYDDVYEKVLDYVKKA
jgi:archaea-specific RecJ-like exonuclease